MSHDNRVKAAGAAKLPEVPAWVRELDDAAAYMMLVTSNAQGELTALERGMHALHNPNHRRTDKDGKDMGPDVRAYAKSVGREKEEDSVQKETMAARVREAVVGNVSDDLSEHYASLTVIHAAKQWLWPALVKKLVSEKGMTFSLPETERLSHQRP